MSWKPQTLVLGPCGIKGCVLLGGLKALEKENMLDNVDTFVGVSSGAIISMFLASGISLDTIILMSVETDLLKDAVDFRVDKIKEQRGLISNDFMRDLLEAPIKEKFSKIPTFEELYMSTGKSLHIVAFNLNRMYSRYFSKESTPHVKILDAVILSMSIPYLFQQNKFEGDIYVDGAIGDNYPISYINKGQEILGLRVDTLTSIEVDPLFILPRIMNHLNKELSQYRSIEGPNIKHVVFTTEVNGTISAGKDDKFKMLRVGFEQLKLFLDRLNGMEIPIIVDASDIPSPPDSS